MDLTKIEHLGIAVRNIDESLKYYEGILGLKCYKIEEVADKSKTHSKIGELNRINLKQQ